MVLGSILDSVTIFAPVQPGPWIHPAYFTMDYVSFLGGKVAESWHWPPIPICTGD